jgi:thiol:disulfide interchange protein DsbG
VSLLWAFAILWCALPPLAVAGDSVDALVERLSGGRARIESRFDAPLGLHGFVIRGEGRRFIVYASADGAYLFSGALFDADGRNLTREALERAAPGIEDLLGTLKAGRWIGEGRAGAGVLYVVADPLCTYCKALYRALRPPVEQGRVEVRWVLAGLLSQESARLAARALAQASVGRGRAALAAVFGEGAVLETAVSDEATEIEREHRALAQRHGIEGTPHLAFRARSGSVQTLAGLVEGKRLEDILQTLTNEVNP